MKDIIYLDNAASSPLDPEVAAEMARILSCGQANPHGARHVPGRLCSDTIVEARQKISQTLFMKPDEIIFTSGATEANNLAILGFLLQRGRASGHAVTTRIEHPSVLECFREFERLGGKVDYIDVSTNGRVELADVAVALRPDTQLVSVMTANNETGVVQPVREISAICRERKITFHSDVSQALGKIPVDFHAFDMASLSAHKMHGPIGVGMLFLSRGITVKPRQWGGGQQFGIRSGTLSPMLCSGLATTVSIAVEKSKNSHSKLLELEHKFLNTLDERAVSFQINGTRKKAVPGLLNISLKGVSATAVLTGIPQLAISTGAACSSATGNSSHVLRALGLDDVRADRSFRVAFSRTNTLYEARRAAEMIADITED